MTNVAESGIINASGTNQTKYYYDSLSQLVREDNPYVNKTYTYEYDGNGNIKSKKTYAYTTGTLGSVEDTVTYSYGNSDWKDLLTSYDGTTISYDASGNPLNWTDERTITWVGRQLDSIMSPDGALWKFKYDHNGLRTEREYSYSGEIVLKTEYTWVDEKLVKEYRSGGMNTTPITLEYFYNGEDLIGFSIQEGDAAAVNYYYGKTNNGEIRFIYDANGNIVTTYLYDAWGNPIPTDESSDSEVGEINPFRYKSYYYDSETRLYYLRSRSYDPVVGRFLNADAVEYINQGKKILIKNIFCYCENNSVMNSDTKGTSSIKFLAVGFQVCVNIGRVTLGVEFLWSLSDGKLYIFTFFGGSKDLGGKTLKLKDLVNKFKNIAYSKNAIAKLTKTKFSGGIFVSIIVLGESL